jgi:hypothetical protein
LTIFTGKMWVLGSVHCYVVRMTKNIYGKSLFFSLQYVLGYINKKGPNNELHPGRISHSELVAHPIIVALYTNQSELSLCCWLIFLDCPFVQVISERAYFRW